jgi:predicted amidophosphoribosyltransferase
MGHISFGGYDYTIENPKGSTRSGVDASGKPWSIDIKDTYGYILRKIGVDGDHLDMFINDDADLDTFNGRVFIVDQKNPDGTFDEHKVMYGYPNWSAARKAYERNYEPGWWDSHVMQMIGVKKADFDKWLGDSDHKTKPFADYWRTKNADTVSDPADQLLADIKDREQAAKLVDLKPTWNENELTKIDDQGIVQLRKKAQQDLSTSKVLLGTTDIQKGSKKENTLQANIAQAETDIKALDAEIQRRNEEKRRMIDAMEAGGAMVDHLKDMGVDVTDNIAEMRKAKKQAEKDNSQEGKMRKMATNEGNVYGFAYKGRLYLDPRKVNANLPLHEYGHLWCEAFRRLNPEGWKDVVGVMKQDADTWKFVKNLYPELTSEDDIAEEMIARGSGDNGEERIRQEFERMSQRDPSYKGKWNNIWKNISKAIQDFWKKMGDFLHIAYESPKQVYDQVLKDFAEGVNPRKRVEEWLRQRDDEYLNAVEDGNTAKATELFNEALKENIGNGMTPFVAVDRYRNLRSMAHKVKNGKAADINKAAKLMAPLIPENAVLIPAPSHTGKVTDMLKLAKAIARQTGSEVADILTSAPRESQYDTKKQGNKPIASKDMGISVNGEIPEGKIPVVIDNVVDSGNTAEACIRALGTGIVASLADSTERGHVASLKSAEPVVYDKNGNIIPLSQRFEFGKPMFYKPDTAEDIMDEVEGRRELSAAIESSELQKPSAKEFEVRQRATDAVMTAINKTGVKINEVSQREADDMMQLYAVVNERPIIENALRERTNKRQRYAVINVRDPYGVPAFFEKRQYAKEYQSWGNRFGGMFKTFDLEPLREDHTEEELREAAEIMPMSGWHGSGAVFTKFDHSHMGEGAGSQTFGYGTYLSDNRGIGEDYARMTGSGWTYLGKERRDYAAGKNLKDETIRDILSNLDLDYHYKEAVGKVRHYLQTAIKDYEDNMADLSKDDMEDYKEHKAVLEFVNSLKYSDFQEGKKNLYKVEIPDDNGENYLDYLMTIKKPLRRKIAYAVRSLDGDPEQSVMYPQYKNGWESLANMIERNQWAYKEIRERLVQAFGGRLEDEKKVSDLMSSIGFVGVKYPAGTIFGNGRGATNYVIFNEDNAKIQEHIQFMFEEPDNKPVFYSNAMKAVKGISQGKATPEQWLKMIEKSGGLKAGEDKWIGLSDWLRWQQAAGKKTVTKQEIEDYIRQHQIEINDTKYSKFIDIDNNPTMQELRREFDELVKKYEDSRKAINEEANTVNQEMLEKYGKGWAVDPGKLDKEDRDRLADMSMRYKKLHDNDPRKLAFEEMVNKHGDDFSNAFEVNYGNGKLVPQRDGYYDELSEEAKHFLQFDEQPINSVRLGYTTEGLDNKREIALTVPTIEPYNEGDNIHFGDAGGGRAIAWIRFGDTIVAEESKEQEAAKVAFDEYVQKLNKKYGHDVLDVFAHPDFELAPEEKAEMDRLEDEYIRTFNESTKKVLVIDEIQSKRHQDAREKGYKGDYEKNTQQRDEMRQRHRDINNEMEQTITRDMQRRDEIRESKKAQALIDEDGYVKEGKSEEYQALFDNDKELNELYEKRIQLRKDMEELERQMREINGDYNEAVPNAPFEKNWHELAMKRMLRYAAENGYDKIAWTTGDQQAERYDIGGVVPYIDVKTNPKEEYFYRDLRFSANGNGCRVAADSNGKITLSEGLGDGVEGKTLNEVFGKDVASMIMEAKDGSRIDLQNKRIGGEGMKGFYDQILPRFMDKYGKKWGVKTGEIELPELKDAYLDNGYTKIKNGLTMHSIDVTPEMKESVMEGQPMFQKSKGGKMYGWTDGKQIFLTPAGMNPNTPAHEYTHLWAKYVEENDPELWKDIVKVMKQTDMWKQVRENPNYRSIWEDDNRMASEVLSRLSGATTEEEFVKAATGNNKDSEGILDAVKSALKRFWEYIKNLFSSKNRELFKADWQTVARMPLKDLLRGFNPVEGKTEKEQPMFHVGEPIGPAEELSDHAKEIFKAAKERFGATRDLREAGYVLPDGTMLDFSGRHLMNPGSDTSHLRGRRTTDHRDIADINYERDGNTKSGIETSMPDFIKSGAIRIDDNAGSINLAVNPTEKQLNVLRQLIARNEGYVTVDFGDGWDSDHYAEYEDVKPQRVLADIVRYFDDGIKPISRIASEPGVQSLMEGNLFTDADFLPEQETATGKKKPTNMSDEELLAAIGDKDGKERRKLIDIYDNRHTEEREDEVQAYSSILEDNDTSLEDAYEMYGNVFRQLKDGGYSTSDRTKLLAQIEALEDYIDLKEFEKSEQDEVRAEQQEIEQMKEERLAEAKAEYEQKQEEAKKQFEQQQNEIHKSGYDLTQMRLRPLREGETCHVERRYVENGYFSFTGKDKIESIDDIAYIFRQLEDAAVENVFCVLVKDGTPTIIHLGMGSYIESPADISPALAAYYELKPDKVYFVHNHPSGNLKCSKNDQNVWTHMKRIFGNKMEDGIIIDTKSGKYGLFNDNMSLPGMRMPEAPENSVPMKVYSFSKQVFDEDWNPETAFDAGTALRVAKFVSSHRLGDHKKMSLIVMGQNYKVTGNVFLPYTELSQVANEAAADLIAKYMNQMGGTIVSLYGNYEYGYDAKDQVNKLQKLLDRRNVFLVDVVHVDNPDHYKSIREMGYIREPDPTVYNASEPVTDPNEIQRLDNEPTEIGYRNVVMNEDGTLGSPMANRLGRKGVGRKPTSMFNFEEWERSDENPDLATEDGKIDLIKPDSKEVGNVDYNPYIHIRPTLVNKQFKQAWERPNLVYVRTEYPASELTSGYHAEKAKLSVGRHPWNGGELILSRWDKPIEIVPWEEVADDWVKEFEGTEGIHFDIIPPKLLPILAERGMTILPPHKGMGKACNDAYEAFKKSQEKAKVVDMQLKQIEDMYTEGLLPAEAADMKYRVDQMSPRELVMQYKRLNDQMLDEDGLNIDEQEDAFRQKWADQHGWPPSQGSGFGKATADFYQKQVDKYTFNKMSLRWDILDRIKELGLEAYIDKDLEQYVDINDLEGAKSADIVKMYRQTTPAENRANIKFNAQLDEYAKGKMSSGKMFELGEPSPILKTCGVNGKQIKMKQSVLADHMDKHDLRFDDLKNLPTALYHPIMVYQWGDKAQSNVIVTELTTKDGRKVTVTIRVNKTGDVLDVEKITSVHGKDLERIIKEINTEKSEFAKDNLKYLNKKKALDWLTMDPPKGSRIDNRELNSAANILKSFENPTLSDENLRNIYGNYIVAGDETADMLGGVKVIYELEAPESGTLGWYDPNDNSVHVVLPEHVDAGEVKRTVCHEKLGHEGLVALMGSQEEVDKFGQFIFKSAAKDVRQRILDKANENDPGWKDPKRFSHAAQEVFADIAADGPRTAEEFSLWTKVKYYLINLLNKLGLRIRGLLNDHDLRYYVLKTGEALKRWNQMTPQEQKVTAREETDYDLMRSRRGRPRKRNNESMAQYLQRLRDWERWKIAEEEAAANNDPMPEAEKINEKWHEKFNNDLAEWKRQNNIEDDTETLGEFPKRERGESPQEYAARVADYETKVDAWKEAPSLFDYLQQANDEYRREYAAWKERYGIREQESVDMGLYEGDPDRLPHIVDPEDLEADMRAEAELAEAVGIDMSPEGAKRHTKLSIVERRKNLESANAEDAIWIHDLVKKLNTEAKLQGVKPEELRAAMADIIEGTYFEDVIKDEASNIISIEDISDKLPIKRTPGLEAIMSEIKDWYDYFFHAIEDAGLRNDAGYVEQGYVNHVWDKSRSNPEAWSKYVENFQRTKSPNMRERLFNTYREGRDVGLVPKFDDIADILAYYSSSNNQAIANKKFLDDLSFIVVEQKNSDGEVVTVLPLMNSRKPNIAVADFYKMYQVPGVGDVYVLKDVQRQFANVFGTMRTGDIPEWLSQVGKGYDVVSSTAKKIELAFSAFHMGALTEVAMAQMRPDRALRALGQYIIFDCAKTGTIPAYAHPEDFKLAAGHLVQLGATQDYSAADVNNVTEKLREIVRQLAKEENLAKKGAGIAATPIAAALDYINKGMDKVLWNYLHDGLKIACFKMFAEQIDKRVEKKGLTAEQREQLLDEAGQYVNDTFGGQYWELLNVSPALIKWMRRAFLSPDWLISTQRHFLANFGFGSVYSESGFLNYLRYNADNIKRAFGFDVPRDENRRFRSKNAKQCYLLGVCGFFYILMNAINAMFRAKDESKEKEKADEIRQTNPDYKSPYELAYPDGMKWYDYTMYGNTIGQQTHLFLGRYDDGTEWYARWGKQFREFPELFMGRHGVEFPTPLMERMSGKANPIGRYLMYDLPLTVGMYGYKQPRETQEIAEKYGNTVALLAMTAKKFIPYSVPTQQDKEFKMFDLVMPSQKGFTRWKAVDYFKTYVQAGDMDGVMRTYNAAVMNGIDAEDCLKAAIATVKATQRKELSDGIVDLQSAMERYDAEKDVAEKKRLRRKIFGYLAEQNYKVFTKDEAREQVEFFLSGEQPKQADNDINKYVQLATSADVRDEYRLEMIRQQSKKYADEVKTAEGDRQKKLEESYGNWLDIYDIVKDANREIGRLKRQLGKGDDDSAIMDEIRSIRKQAQQEVDKIQAP